MNSTRAIGVLSLAIGRLLGGVLIYSGLNHLVQPMAFASSVAAYELSSGLVVSLVAFFLPATQIMIGWGLIFAQERLGFVWLSLALFSVFVGAQLLVLLDGRQVSCGCFGISSEPIGAMTLALPILGLGWAMANLLFSMRKYGAFRASTDSL